MCILSSSTSFLYSKMNNTFYTFAVVLITYLLDKYLFVNSSENHNNNNFNSIEISKSLQLSSKLTTNPVSILIAIRVLQWRHFNIVYRNPSEKKLLHLLTKHEDLKKSSKTFEFENINIEILHITDPLFSSASFSFNKDSSCHTNLNFICFLEPNEILELATKMPSFHSHSWLIITSLNTSQWGNGMNFFPGLTINSDVFLASIISLDQEYFYKIYEVYKIYHNYPLKIHELCDVSLNGNLIGSNYLEHKYQRRKNLEEFHIKIVGLDFAAYNLITIEKTNGKLDIQGGLVAEIFRSISHDINIRYSLQILKGYSFGSFKNGSWNGMIGQLSRNEVDMSCSEISMVSDRLEYIEFTNSFMSLGRRIYIRRTVEMKSINWLFFANPFSPFLLVSIVICFVGLVGVLWIFIMIFKNKFDELDNIHEATWVVLCAFCQKGAVLIPTSRSGKFIFALIYITFLIIYTCYSATLTSQLTFAPPIHLPFNDLNGLLDSEGWNGGPVKGDLTQVYMEKTCPEILAKGENPPCELLIKLWEKIVAPKVKQLPLDFQEGLIKVLNEKFAFVAATYGARNEIITGLSIENICNIQELDGDHVLSNLAFGLRKGFPFKKLINYKLLQLHQFGILSRLKNFWLPKLNKDCNIRLENFVQISISDIALAPIIVFFGLILSCIILTFEIWFTLKQKKKC